MSQSYIGTIDYFGFGFPPKGWALCNGQTLPISSNQALFALLGTTYGGNGVTTFMLPNLQGRVPIGVNNSNNQRPQYPLGQAAGQESHVLTVQEIPSHNHTLVGDASSPGSSNLGTPSTSTSLGNAANTAGGGVTMYSKAGPNAQLSGATVGTTGQNVGHENRMPFTVISACICLQGLFPSRN